MKKSGAFTGRTACDDDIYIIEENINERAGEAYYNLWCRPSKRG